MRKALLAAAAACSMLVPSMSDAAAFETFTVLLPVTHSPTTAPLKPTCATGGFNDSYDCQKTTWTRVARCAYLTDPATAQTGRDGTVGYVFKIDATKVRGADLNDDRDNKLFSLEVTSTKHVSNQPGKMDLPDVDIVFYENLGVCASAVEVAAGVYVGEGSPPQELLGSLDAKASYTGPGDELDLAFPSGAYAPLLNPTTVEYATTYWAIVTIFGGTSGPDGTNIKITCKGRPANAGACANGWYLNA